MARPTRGASPARRHVTALRAGLAAPLTVILTALLSVVLAVVLTACGSPADGPPSPMPDDGVPSSASPRTPGEGPRGADGPPSGTPAGEPVDGSTAPQVPVRPATDSAPASVPAPVRVVVGSLGIDMAVDPVGVAADGAMELPPTGDRAGWYRYGPAPGSDAGTTVLASHVDTRAGGLGPFARLVDAAPGATVDVTDAAGATRTYTVTDVRLVPKGDVPLDDVFDRTGSPRLVLVTCGGGFDRSTGHYADNVLVTAVPAR